MPSKLNVIFVCSSFPPQENALTSRILPLIKICSSRSNYITVLAPSKFFEFRSRFTKIPVFPPFSYSSFSVKVRLLIEICHAVLAGFMLTLTLLFSKYTNKRKTLVFLSSPSFVIAYLSALISVSFDVDFIFDVRDRYPAVLFDQRLFTSHSLIGTVLQHIENFLVSSSLVVSTVTTSLRHSIQKISHNTPVYLLKNGFNPDIFYPTNNSLPPSSEIGLKVIIHGNLGKYFNTDLFLSIARIVQEANHPIMFTLLGYGSSLKCISKYKYKCVKIVDNLSQVGIAEILRNSHLELSLHLDSPVMRKAFPVKIYEAIGSGIPSIVYPFNDAAIELEEKRLGWGVSSSSPENIVTLLTAILEKPNEWLEFRHNCIKVSSTYSRFVSANLFWNYIDNLAG